MERYFLGSNTHSGFAGFYDEVTDNINRVYLLKGGAGTGKSSLMKKVLKRGVELGYCCESWHCSGDPNSLDGVYIKDIDVAVIDATSPHAVEPKMPAVKDDIVNLLEYVDKDKLYKHREAIEKLSKCKKECYMLGYEHLNIGYCHLKQSMRIVASTMDRGAIIEKAREFAHDILKEMHCASAIIKTDFKGGFDGEDLRHKEKKDRVEKRFCRAITPDGVVAYFDHIEGKNLWHIKGESASVDLFLKTVIDTVVQHRKRDDGLPAMVFFNPLDSRIIDGLVIGDIAVHREVGKAEGAMVYDLRWYEGDFDKYAVSRGKAKMKDEIDMAVDYFSKARSIHMGIEKYYISAMDFDGIDRRTECLIEEIFQGRDRFE